MRAAIYTRVSSREQIEGYSLSAQREICTKFIEEKGWRVIAHYEEQGRSGKSDQRPQFQQMVEAARRGKFDVIVVHKLDRFSRSLLDVLLYLDKLNKCNVSFVSVAESFDFTTPQGRLMLAVTGAFAQWYLDNLASEIKKGKRQRAAEGGWNGTLSFGYTTPKQLRHRLITELLSEDVATQIEDHLQRYAEAEESDAIPDPVQAEGVRYAFALYATGKYSFLEIAHTLNERGYRLANRTVNVFGEHTVRDMLQNRFYLGETSYGQGKGGRNVEREWYEGAHEALVTRDLFDMAQTQRRIRDERRGRPRPGQKHWFPLAGLLQDECGITWRGSTVRNKRYYRQREQRALKATCNAGVKAVPAHLIEDQLEQVLVAAHIPDEWYQRARREVVEVRSRDNPNEAALLKKLERIKKLYVEGDISDMEYKKMRDDIKEQLQVPEQLVIVQPSEVEVVYRTVANIHEVWKLATDEERGQLARLLFAQVIIADGQITQVKATPALSAMLFGVASGGKDRSPALLWQQVEILAA